ncbi:MAG: rod shape-determining protein MreC [Azoarcus sp.]|jgi:rod shape-determining protein MreC|nr:rod shape-determining protein MreC [Azoarcus sp.]
MPSTDFQTLPAFKRGTAPWARLLVYVTICVAMLVADLRFGYVDPLRRQLAVFIQPVQSVVTEPVKLVGNATDYFSDLADLQRQNAELRQRQFGSTERLFRLEQLERENAELRGILGMSKRVGTRSVAAEVRYNAPPGQLSRKIVLSQGEQASIKPGLAVVDADGLLGQVTRVYPAQSEVTLITNNEQMVPVQVERNGLRGVLAGTGLGLELRFMLSNADIQPGDRLVTSGLDGVFPPGLPAAVVQTIDRSADAFARINCHPLGGVEQSAQVLVLGRKELPPRPPKPEDIGEPPPVSPPAPGAKRSSGTGG